MTGIRRDAQAERQKHGDEKREEDAPVRQHHGKNGRGAEELDPRVDPREGVVPLFFPEKTYAYAIAPVCSISFLQ